MRVVLNRSSWHVTAVDGQPFVPIGHLVARQADQTFDVVKRPVFRIFEDNNISSFKLCRHVSSRGKSAVPPVVSVTPFRCDQVRDRKSTRLNSSHRCISYAVFCLKK